MNINGIQVKLLAPDDKGNLTNIETPVFATVRKCPKLLGEMKKVKKARVRWERRKIEAGWAEGAMDTATSENIDKVEEALNEAEGMVEKAELDMLKQIRAFVVQGFLGAGYTKDIADRYADLVNPANVANLYSAAVTGCGVVDFTKQKS